MTLANTQQFSAALMEALGLKVGDHIVSISISVCARDGPTVTIERYVHKEEVVQISNLLRNYDLVPKDDGK